MPLGQSIRGLILAMAIPCLSNTATAQGYGAWGTDITLGGHRLAGAKEFKKGGVFADALLTGGRRISPTTHIVGGAGIGVAGNFSLNDMCTPTPSGGCEESQWFVVTSMLVGMARDLDHKTARVLIGAAQYAGDSASVWGVQMRGDIALQIHRHFGMVPTARVTYLPSYAGERLFAWALGLGISFR